MPVYPLISSLSLPDCSLVQQGRGPTIAVHYQQAQVDNHSKIGTQCGKAFVQLFPWEWAELIAFGFGCILVATGIVIIMSGLSYGNCPTILWTLLQRKTKRSWSFYPFPGITEDTQRVFHSPPKLPSLFTWHWGNIFRKRINIRPAHNDHHVISSKIPVVYSSCYYTYGVWGKIKCPTYHMSEWSNSLKLESSHKSQVASCNVIVHFCGIHSVINTPL